jgi:hypothetical protein
LWPDAACAPWAHTKFRKEIHGSQDRFRRARADDTGWRRANGSPVSLASTPSGEPFERLLAPLTAVRLKAVDSKGNVKIVACRQAQLQQLPPGAEADENVSGKPGKALIVEFKK